MTAQGRVAPRVAREIWFREDEREFLAQYGVPMVVHQGVEAFWVLHGAELHHRDITVRHVADVMHRAATT